MKKYLFALTAIWFMLTISANGQNKDAARVDVPFSFAVNGTAFPSGSYDILGMSGGGSYLTIENLESGRKAFVHFRNVPLAPGNVQQRTRLIFTKDASGYILHQVRLEGDSHTHDVIHLDITEPTIKPEK
jgi:hypothetical protein